jgi:hypothetical protein
MALHRRRSRLTQHGHNPRQCLRHAGSGEEDVAAPQTFHRRCTQRCPNRVIILHACLACHLCMRLAYQLVFTMLVCGCQRGCGCGCMGAYVCVRTCVLAHIAATVPELACSHDKRCAPNLSGCARRSGSQLRPNVWLFHVAEVWSGSRMGSLLRVVLCVPSGVRSSA